MRKREIEIHIESLVLRGFEPRHREQISESIRAELERLIAEGGVPQTWPGAGEPAAIAMPQVSIAANQTPRRIGEVAARTLYRGAKS